MKIRTVRPHPSDPTLSLVELTKGYFAVIDAAYAREVGKYNWAVKITETGQVYAQSGMPPHCKPNRKLPLHRFIGELVGLSLRADVDHRNGNGLDCRSANLRDATPAQNAANRHMRRDNLTGIKGVTFYRDGRRLPWGANATVNGKRIRRYFATKEEAASAAAVMRMEMHGQFANHGTN